MTVTQWDTKRNETTVIPDGDDYEADIDQVIAAAPPLSVAQRDRLTSLLRENTG